MKSLCMLAKEEKKQKRRSKTMRDAWGAPGLQKKYVFTFSAVLKSNERNR